MARKVGMARPAKNTASDHWEDYLDSGEKLLWQGAPATGIRFSGKGIFISVFGLFFLGFSAVWVYMASMINSGTTIEYAFPLFGLPFVLIGLWMVVGHWLYDAYKRKHARYALTSNRAIIARSMITKRMESYQIDGGSKLELVEADLDTVNFAQRVYTSKNGTNVAKIGFRFIKDGREVYNLMKEVKRTNS